MKTYTEGITYVYIGYYILKSLIQYTKQLSSPINNFSSLLTSIQSSLAAADRVFSLLDEKEVLETDVIKLQDPEYVAKYAREKYLYTKDGELIIKIIDEN